VLPATVGRADLPRRVTAVCHRDDSVVVRWLTAWVGAADIASIASHPLQKETYS
jgi:hypothetical protein